MFCLCGCGETVQNNPGGRQRKFVNATHRKRYQRAAKKQVADRLHPIVTPKRDNETVDCPYIFLGVELTEREMADLYRQFKLNLSHKQAIQAKADQHPPSPLVNPDEGRGLVYVFDQLVRQCEHALRGGQ